MSPCTTIAWAPFDGKYLTSYMMAIVMFALSLTICEIFTKIIKYQSFDLENEGQGQEVEERNLRHSTGNIRLHIGEFFRILTTCEYMFTQTGYTHTLQEMGHGYHNYHDYRQNLQIRFA